MDRSEFYQLYILNSRAYSLMALKADRKLENAKNLADYGLDEPVFSVTGEWSDGTRTQYQMGDETPFADGYYLVLSDDPNVYTISSALNSMFSNTYANIAQFEEIHTVQNASRLVVGTAVDVSYRETSSTLNADQHWFSTVDGMALSDVSVDAQSSMVYMLSSIGANRNGKRAAPVHLYFNIIGVAFWLGMFYLFNSLFKFGFVSLPIDMWGVAGVHTIIKMLSVELIAPFAKGLEKLARLSIPDREDDCGKHLDSRYINMKRKSSTHRKIWRNQLCIYVQFDIKNGEAVL